MLLTVYNSKSDKYGNCYWAVQLEDVDGHVLSRGTIATKNINTYDCRENLRWHVVYKELPIREFNRMVKGWKDKTSLSCYLGCTWEDIRDNLVGK